MRTKEDESLMKKVSQELYSSINLRYIYLVKEEY
jgi:hypothetical protein